MSSPESSLSSLIFHEETKHSELSVRTSSHYLDWDNRPYPFKIYENLPLIPLPKDFARPSMPAVDAISSPSKAGEGRRVDISRLAELLFFSAGLTRKMNTRAGMYYMRAAPATGALYPIELYAICTDIPGLDAGVYHFNPLEFGLVRLREGDYSAWLAEASGRAELASTVTLVFTSFAWRNAWKYEARSYRHWFWDAGVIVANFLATSSAETIHAQIDTGFVDSRVASLLGLSEEKEAPVALAHIGTFEKAVGKNQRDPAHLSLRIKPLSREETEYPIIWKTNSESELHSSSDVRSWRENKLGLAQRNQGKGPTFRLKTLKQEDSLPSLEKTILQRGSTRRFTPRSIPLEHLSAILIAAGSPIPLDTAKRGSSLVDIFFIANQIEGLPSGSYRFDKKEGAVEQLKLGKFRDMSGYLCLDQPLFGDASAVFFLMTDLRSVTEAFGNRGYRLAQFEAGIRAGKIYLSSYALGNGASGSTFYDDAVTEFFSPEAKGLSAMIAVGIGVPAYQARPGKVLLTA